MQTLSGLVAGIIGQAHLEQMAESNSIAMTSRSEPEACYSPSSGSKVAKISQVKFCSLVSSHRVLSYSVFSIALRQDT